MSGNGGVSPAVSWRPQLSVCISIGSRELAEAAAKVLASDRYVVTRVKSADQLWKILECHRPIDCLVVEADEAIRSLALELQKRAIFLPAVIFSHLLGDDVSICTGECHDKSSTGKEDRQESSCLFYHAAEVQLPVVRVGEIAGGIDRAIVQFLKLSTAVPSGDLPASSGAISQLTAQSLLQRQQRRLAEKLRERLGYLGVYYKRNPQNFLRNLSGAEKQKFLEQLKLSYRQIVLKYFDRNSAVNNQIDEFVCLAFFADVPVTQVVEIHMELMDEFATQLKLEGRSEEILLDYRLTLIDAIAHLCEMYRRSIPKDESSTG
ncbi:MAG: circadian clock protein KaiA [Oscillatoriaceae cyanobacterium Prado104]|nr:circadian clock protein KaiA [Oscillatoriaceae cyanobacterium Prado104]